MKKILVSLILVMMLGCGKEKEVVNEVASKPQVAEKEEVVKKEIEEFKILQVEIVPNEKPSIEIALSDEVTADTDIKAYVKLAEDIEYNVVKLKKKIVITGDFDLGKTYNLEILEGLKSKSGETLKERYKKVVAFRDMEPKMVFSNEGIILPAVNEKKISFKSLNVKKVEVVVKKIYENNTTQFLQNLNFKGDGNVFDYTIQNELYKIGDEIFQKEYNLEYLKNRWIQNEIDLSSLTGEKGFYIVEVSFDEEGIDYTFPEDVDDWQKNNFFRNNGRIGKVVLLSDMGIIAQKAKDRFLVTVMNVTKNTPVKDVKVKAFTINNQLIEEKMTDENGEVIFNSSDKIFYISSEKDEEKSILKLEDNQLVYDGYAVDGIYETEGIKTFLYTDRGIYRPGDEINLSIIARNSEEGFPKEHPIKMDIYTPNGQKYLENQVLNNGKNGFYTYSFKTDLDSPTGLWRVDVEVGGATFRKDIPVETIVPYKIKVESELPKELDINNEKNFIVGITSNYLFGAPSSGLKYESELEVREEKTDFEKYKNYIFKNPTNYNFYYNDYRDGVLNDDGKAHIEFEIGKVTPSSVNLTGVITTKVIESGGRPVINIDTISMKKFDTYIGIESSEDRYMKSGDKLNLQVIAVTADGEKLVPGKRLKYRVYKNEYSWWWDYNDYGSFIKSIKTDKNTTLIYEKEFISSEKPYLIDYSIDGTGEIFIEVEDLDTEQTTGTTLYVSSWGDPSISKKVDKLKIETDKKSYKVGEKAKIVYEGTEGAKALITVEKSGQIIKRYWKDVESIKNIEEIDVTEDMFPNGYVSISLFQDYENYTNDRPLRLYGAVPIIVENEERKLGIDVIAPKEIRPNETFKVKVINRAKEKMDYTIAVVDEGLLDITGFTTPNPWNYFYQKEALQVNNYDNYNEIIGKTFGEVHQILKTGGGDFIANSMLKARSKNSAIEEAQRFKPVAMFKGVLTTDENGEGEIEFTMDNYMGSVKVMVVGADRERYGNGETTITVKAPVVINETLPRTLKVGDEFTIPVEIFPLEENIGEVEVSVDFNGEIQREKVTLDNKDKKVVYFKEVVPNKIGVAKIKISLDSSVYDYEKEIDIDINSNNPYIYINDIKTTSDKEKVFIQPDEYIEGSVKSSITISSAPILAMDQRLKWLMRYPYGCVEQTTSSVFPQLFIKELSSEKVFDLKEITGNINSGIGRLSKFQLYDGSFTYWPGDREADLWATNYVGHFLISAKDRGYYIPEDMYSRWLKFSKEQVKNSDKNFDRKTYTLYLLALAGYPEVSEMNLVYENHFNTLSLTGQWNLARTYKLIGEDKIAKEIGDKLSTIVKEQDYDYYVDSYGSNLRDKAIVLGAYYEIYGEIEKNLYEDIVKKLQSKEWLSTQSSGYALLTLANINRESKSDEVSGKIIVDGKVQNFVTKDGKYILNLLPEAKKIEVESEKPLFVNHYWEGIPINYEGESSFKNLKLERNFYNLKGEKYDPTYVASLPSGSSFWLEVKVYPADDVRGYFSINEVALTQILPTGWEIENLRALKQEYPQWIKEKMESTNIEYEDIRDDRVMWFFDFDNYNQREYCFFIKVNTVAVGSYTLPATTVEAMYDNNFEGYLKGFKVEVK